MPINKNREDYRFYKIWGYMKYRCTNKSCNRYKDYGGRGIKVSNQWQIYNNFYNDMWEYYIEHVKKFGEKQTTLDRINVNDDYKKENCKWSTYQEQRINTRNKATYKATNILTGKEYIFNNCAEFCRNHDLKYSQVTDCIGGRQKTHKGFIFTRLTDKER